jgi:signal recognition particle receptor subunit beta
MILNHASALIFVLNPQSDTLKALDDFINIYQYLKKNNKGNCPIFIFVNKADIDMTQQDTRN